MKFKSKFAARWSALIGVGVTAAVALSAVGGGAAMAAPGGADKVTICHRTHSVTNPYRKITVAKASANGDLNGGTGNARGDHGGHQHNGVDNPNTTPMTYTANFPIVGGNAVTVFNPTLVSYAGNNKIWQDIIPPFKIGSTQYPGLNWTTEGKAIYYGTGTSRGLCGKISAAKFVQGEREARTGGMTGVTDTDIKNDLNDQGQDGTINNTSELDTLPVVPETPAGPKVPDTKINTLLTNNNSNPASIKQAIAGVVWYDDNRDGVQQDGEDYAQTVGIVLLDPDGNQYIPTSYKKNAKTAPKFQLASSRNQQTKFNFAVNKNGKTQYKLVTVTITVHTDANGYFEFPNVPAGDWIVEVITPDGYTYTYDSSGGGDGSMPGTNVPEGGVGFAWAGLVRGSSSGSGSSLAATGTNEQGILFGGFAAAVLIAGGITLTVMRRRAR